MYKLRQRMRNLKKTNDQAMLTTASQLHEVMKKKSEDYRSQPGEHPGERRHNYHFRLTVDAAD